MPSRVDGDGRVLLVDDDDTVRRFFVRALTRAGFEVVEAGDGPAGMARIAEDLPSVVVLDNRMPGMSGLEVLDELRSDPQTRTLPVILVTAQGEVEERVVGLSAPSRSRSRPGTGGSSRRPAGSSRSPASWRRR